MLTEAERRAYTLLRKNYERWKYLRIIGLLVGVGIVVTAVWLRLEWEQSLMVLTGSMTMKPISGSQTYFAAQAAVILALAHLLLPLGVFIVGWTLGRWKGNPSLALLLGLAAREDVTSRRA